MIDLQTIFSADFVGAVGKYVLLGIMAIYFLFSLIVSLQVRSLQNIITIARFNLSIVLQLLFFIHLLLIISLFFIALAIL